MDSLSLNIAVGSKVLVAPLNWGLGHATRCIPIIRALLDSQCIVSIASDGSPLKVLQDEFPLLDTYRLPAYDMNYSYGHLSTNIFMQLPKLANTLRKEKKHIALLQKTHQWDVIISDCRYGVYAAGAKNILITHQLNIQFKNILLKKQANIMNGLFLRNYDQIWVPDFADQRLSGSLSDAGNLKNIRYLGAVSRMLKQRLPCKYDLVVILSGPEPSRTEYEKLLLKILSKSTYRIAWVRGIEDELNEDYAHIESFTRLGSSRLNQLINMSKMVISRTGYTTIMDLYTLNKKALLVPTPGQTEQEYLGEWIRKNNLFTILRQEELELNLSDTLDIALAD